MPDELEGLAFEEREEHRLRDGVVSVGLLEDPEIDLAREVAQDDGVGFDLRGGAGEGGLIDAGLQVQGQGLPDDRVAAIVDRQGGIGGKKATGGHQQEERGFHRG